MHPPLGKPHPLCQKEIEDLKFCHVHHNIAKFWGKCNPMKVALDSCFKVYVIL